MNVHFADPRPDVFDIGAIESQLLDAVAVALGLSDPVSHRTGARAGGLAPWQEKRVARYITGHASVGVQVAELASLARLSTSHFSKAFRASFGMSPYAMICRYRVSEAMRLMLGTEWPLVDIAQACGFADQSHFSRTFHRHTDTSPGRWRRSHAPRQLPSS